MSVGLTAGQNVHTLTYRELVPIYLPYFAICNPTAPSVMVEDKASDFKVPMHESLVSLGQ